MIRASDLSLGLNTNGPEPYRACSICGRTRVELNYETVEVRPGIFANGPYLLCVDCHANRHPEQTTSATTERAAQRKPTDPDWIRFRRRVIDAMTRDGMCVYVDQDSVAGRCPVCGGALGVRFVGRKPRAVIVCHDSACDEREVVESLGKARR